MHITEVRLTSQDPMAAGRWYPQLLGLPMTPADGRVELHAGSSRLLLTPGPTGPGVHHLAFTVPQIWFGEAVDHLAGRVELIRVEGRRFFEGPPHWNSSSVYFSAPDGTLLEYIMRRDLPDETLTATAAVGSSVAAISEVGIAVPDVRATYQELGRRLRLEPFGVPSPQFTPVGDQHGLFICVSLDRRWAPQGRQQPGGGPLHVKITTADGAGELNLQPGEPVQLNAG